MSQEPENKPNDNAEEDSSEALMVDEIALGGTPAGVATNEAL